MMKRSIAFVVCLLVLAGCESRLNPFNWFGGGRSSGDVVVQDPAQTDPRPFVDQVTGLSLERAPGGAILVATGLTPRQGYWNGDLIPQRSGNRSVLIYQFRVAPPPSNTRVSTELSRTVRVATFLSDQTLQGVREVRVLGARSSRSVRR